MRGALRLRRPRESGGRSAPSPKARPSLKAPSPSCTHHRHPFRPPLRPTAPLTAFCALKCTPTLRITPTGLSARPLSPTRNDTPTIGHPPSTSHGPMVTRGLANSIHSVEPNIRCGQRAPDPRATCGATSGSQRRAKFVLKTRFTRKTAGTPQAKTQQKTLHATCRVINAGRDQLRAPSRSSGRRAGGRLFSRGGR